MGFDLSHYLFFGSHYLFFFTHYLFFGSHYLKQKRGQTISKSYHDHIICTTMAARAAAVDGEVVVMGQPAKKSKPTTGILRIATKLSVEQSSLVATISKTKYTLRKSSEVAIADGVAEDVLEAYELKGEAFVSSFANKLADICREKASLEQNAIDNEKQMYDVLNITEEQRGFLSHVRRTANIGQLEQISNFCDVLKATANQMIEFLRVDTGLYAEIEGIAHSVLQQQQELKRHYVKPHGAAHDTQEADFGEDA